jgi:plasmid maintenance system antidote protein VapI
MAMKLGKAFDQSASFWLNLQKNWELSQLDEADYIDITPIQSPA